MPDILLEPETWVAVAFVIFVTILVQLGMPGLIIQTLDTRSVRIKAELDEAARPRRDAEGILADYQRKRDQVHIEAAAIMENAHAEARRVASETAVKTEEFIARRKRMVETRIAQAEAQAAAAVRSVAVDAAIAAAEKLLTDGTRWRAIDLLIEDGIREIKANLN
jgi:F-type H+-transporting ATPase subunit b